MSDAKLRTIRANGINLRIAEQGEGPLVLLIHGWPESWYSWRHQLPALAHAGYWAVAPDMRGYGHSDKPPAIADYDMHQLCGDAVGILDALGEKTAVVIGHDWGSMIAWHCVLLHPERFTSIVAMSVPYFGRQPKSPIDLWKDMYGEDFFYILYFQDEGKAEAEFDADPHGILSRLYVSPDSPREEKTIKDSKATAGGWIGRLGKPKELPDWLTEADLDYYVNEFKHAGFRGGINYYRNFTRNWETTPQLDGAKVTQPALFIAGEKDIVIRGADAARLESLMKPSVPKLRNISLFPGAGHWIQQERPKETNEAVLNFLRL